MVIFKFYLKHLLSNWFVAFKSLLLFIFHFLHGLVPCKYTSHEYLGFHLYKNTKGEIKK